MGCVRPLLLKVKARRGGRFSRMAGAAQLAETKSAKQFCPQVARPAKSKAKTIADLVAASHLHGSVAWTFW